MKWLAGLGPFTGKKETQDLHPGGLASLSSHLCGEAASMGPRRLAKVWWYWGITAVVGCSFFTPWTLSSLRCRACEREKQKKIRSNPVEKKRLSGTITWGKLISSVREVEERGLVPWPGFTLVTLLSLPCSVPFQRNSVSLRCLIAGTLLTSGRFSGCLSFLGNDFHVEGESVYPGLWPWTMLFCLGTTRITRPPSLCYF